MASYDLHKCRMCGKEKEWILMAETCDQAGSCKHTKDEVCMVCDSKTEEDRLENLANSERMGR